MAKGPYTPQLKPELITRLYHVAKKFDMPMTRMLNHMVETCLTELEAVNADEWEIAEPVRPEQPSTADMHDILCRHQGHARPSHGRQRPSRFRQGMAVDQSHPRGRVVKLYPLSGAAQSPRRRRKPLT
jgi:hypothetical protein